MPPPLPLRQDAERRERQRTHRRGHGAEENVSGDGLVIHRNEGKRGIAIRPDAVHQHRLALRPEGGPMHVGYGGGVTGMRVADEKRHAATRSGRQSMSTWPGSAATRRTQSRTAGNRERSNSASWARCVLA